jgi:hypothetical protein
MNRIELSDSPLVPVSLEPERRATLGAGGTAPVLAERISLGQPLPKVVDQSAVDDETREFLDMDDACEYYLVGLRCSFAFDPNKPFRSAWIQAELAPLPGFEVNELTVWSLEPTKEYEPLEVARTASVDARLKLTPVAIAGAEMGGKRERAQHYTRQEAFLEGLGEGTRTPAWEFTKTPGHEIRGPFRLRFVARLTAGAKVQATVSAGATVAKSLLGVSYVAAFDEVPEIRRAVIGPGPPPSGARS